MIAVAGPRIDPAALGAPPGVEVRAFVPDLYRHLVAVRPGGRPGRPDDDDGAGGRRDGRSCTSRCANHFEQNRHVAPPARPLRRRPADGLRRRRRRTPSPRPSRPRSTGRSTIGRSRPTARPAPRRSSRRWSDRGASAVRRRGSASRRTRIALPPITLAISSSLKPASSRSASVSWTMPGRIERRLDGAVEIGAERDVVDAGDVRRRT